MKWYCLLLPFLMFPLLAQSQNLNNRYTREISPDAFGGENSEFLMKPKEPISASKGSPLVFEQSRKGAIYFGDGSKVEDLPLNYDCFNNEVLYTDAGTHFVVDSRSIDYIEFEGNSTQPVYFKRMLRPRKKDMIFMEILYEGDHCAVYKRHSRTFIKSEPSGAYSSNASREEYIHKSAHYIRVGDAEPVKLKPSKKFIVKKMSDSGKQVEAFIRQEGLDLRSDDHLAKLASFYEGLQQ